MQTDLTYKAGEWRFPPKVTKRYCYRVRIEVDNTFVRQLEGINSDFYEYKCTECNLNKYIKGSDLEAELIEGVGE